MGKERGRAQWAGGRQQVGLTFRDGLQFSFIHKWPSRVWRGLEGMSVRRGMIQKGAP